MKISWEWRRAGCIVSVCVTGLITHGLLAIRDGWTLAKIIFSWFMDGLTGVELHKLFKIPSHHVTEQDSPIENLLTEKEHNVLAGHSG